LVDRQKERSVTGLQCVNFSGHCYFNLKKTFWFCHVYLFLSLKIHPRPKEKEPSKGDKGESGKGKDGKGKDGKGDGKGKKGKREGKKDRSDRFQPWNSVYQSASKIPYLCECNCREVSVSST